MMVRNVGRLNQTVMNYLSVSIDGSTKTTSLATINVKNQPTLTDDPRPAHKGPVIITKPIKRGPRIVVTALSGQQMSWYVIPILMKSNLHPNHVVGGVCVVLSLKGQIDQRHVRLTTTHFVRMCGPVGNLVINGFLGHHLVGQERRKGKNDDIAFLAGVAEFTILPLRFLTDWKNLRNFLANLSKRGIEQTIPSGFINRNSITTYGTVILQQCTFLVSVIGWP